MTLSIVICTKDRPDEIGECVDSILKQSIKPDELIIIDASKDKVVKAKIEEKLKSNDEIKFIYQHTKPGLTYQRNIGVSKSMGDILLFLDDDVILDKDYVKEILEVYINDESKSIAGVQGTIINTNSGGRFSRLFSRLFLFPTEKDGKMQASGFGTGLANPKRVAEVEVFCGCSSYRREVFNYFKFDENLLGYAWMEDDDFSYRVSRKYKLMQTPFAKLMHKSTPTGRVGKEKLYKQKIYNHWYLFQKDMPKTLKNYLAFFWSDLGILLQSIFFERRATAFKGAIRGHWKILLKDKSFGICNVKMRKKVVK